MTAWASTFDPDEEKDYTVDWTAEMAATTDAIASASFSVPASWTAAGLVLASTSWDSNRATVWVSVANPALQGAALLGQLIPITCTVVTTGGRTLQRTVFLSVEER